MLNTLFVVVAVVILLWVIILAIFLMVSRQQPDVQAQLKALDERLIEMERESSKPKS